MNKFKVGDRVRMITQDHMVHTATITYTRDDGHITFDWDDGIKDCGSLDQIFTLMYPSDYEDFFEKMRERMNNE